MEFTLPLDLQLCWAYHLAAELEGNLGMKEYAQQYAHAAETLKKTKRTKSGRHPRVFLPIHKNKTCTLSIPIPWLHWPRLLMAQKQTS